MNNNNTFVDLVLTILLGFFLFFGSIAFGVYAFTTSAKAADRPVVNLCTGSAGNAYADAGATIARMAGGRLKVNVINTQGTWDNIGRVHTGECDAFIGQPDGTALLARQNPSEAKDLKAVTRAKPAIVSYYDK